MSVGDGGSAKCLYNLKRVSLAARAVRRGDRAWGLQELHDFIGNLESLPSVVTSDKDLLEIANTICLLAESQMLVERRRLLHQPGSHEVIQRIVYWRRIVQAVIRATGVIVLDAVLLLMLVCKLGAMLWEYLKPLFPTR